MQLGALPGRFSICRLNPTAPLPADIESGALCSVTRTAAELSVVCEEQLAPVGARVEPGFACLMVEGPLAFDAVGVLASLVRPLADAGISVFSISTFDTDYLLVQEAQFARAVEALRAAGHTFST